MQLIVALPSLKHVDHIIGTTRAIGQSAICSRIITWLGDIATHRLGDKSNGVVIIVKFLGWNYRDAGPFENLLSKLPIQFQLGTPGRGSENNASLFSESFKI